MLGRRWIDELVTEDIGAVRFAKFLGPILRNRYADFAFEIYADPAGADRGADRRDDAGHDPDSRSGSASASRFTFDLPLAEYGDAIKHRRQCRSDSVIFRD